MQRPDIQIHLTTIADIAEISALTKTEPDALLPVSQIQLFEWATKKHSLVAKTKSGMLVAHHAAVFYEPVESEKDWPYGYIEGRSSITKPEFRKMGIGSLMKNAIDEHMSRLYPNVPFVSFTESGSGIRHINENKGYKELPWEKVPQRLFYDCPDICFKKTGVDCGCKVYVKYPDKKEGLII